MPAVDLPDLDLYAEINTPWASTDDVRCTSLVEANADLVVRNLLVASWILDRATGRQYGLQTVTLRPSRRLTEDQLPTWGNVDPRSRPYMPSRCPYWPSMCTSNPCGCQTANRVMLDGKVRAVTQVTLDGEVLDPATYHLSDDRRWLYRATGYPYWPLCPNPYLPLDQPDTFGVTVERGKPVPPAGVDAAAALACELSLPDGECTVSTKPSELVTLVREGRTGLTAVDYFVRFANPGGISRRARVSGVEDLP